MNRTHGKRVEVLFATFLAGLKAVLVGGDLFEITSEAVKDILNTGGSDFMGTDKIKIPEQFESVKETAISNKLNGLVIVGGDDSNTNTSFIAEKALVEL